MTEQEEFEFRLRLERERTPYDAKADDANFQPTGSAFENTMAGLGKAAVDTARGIGQLTGIVSQKEVDEAKRLDAPLMKTTGGAVGNVVGQIAQMALPGAAIGRGTAALGAAGPFVNAALTSGGFAATQPVETGGSRLENTATATGFGLAGQGVASGLGALASRVAKKTVPDEVRHLYDRAQSLGIPVNASQLGNSKFAKTVQSTIERLPLTGAQASRDVQQEAFNRAVSKTFGENAPKVTRDVYASAKGRIGGEFERLSSGNTLKPSNSMLTDLSATIDESIRFASDDTTKAVTNIVDELLSKVDGAGNIPGKAYQSFDSKIGQLMRAGGEKAHYLGRVRDAVRSAMDSSISQADQAAWTTARQQYRNLKTVRDLVAKEGADGNISPSLLMGRVTANQAGKEAMAMGRGGDLGELAMIGRQFVRDPIPDSGTAQRLFSTGVLGGAGGVGNGPEGLTFDPATAAMAIAGPAVLGRGFNWLMNSPAGAGYVLGGGATGLLAGAAKPLPLALPALGLLDLPQQ